MEYFSIPGVSVAFLRDRAVVWSGAYGVKDTSAPSPVTTTTLFQAGSISKPVAAVAVMRMVQDGVLALDDDVDKRSTGGWRLPSDDRTKVEKVTLRRLLSHSAGLGVHGFAGYEVGAAIPTLPQILDGQPPAKSPPVRFESVPGAQMTYSGGGFVVVEQLVTDVAKKPFSEVAKVNVFAPLGLTHTTFAPVPSAAMKTDIATAHVDGAPIAGRWRVHPELTAAGLWTTPSELAAILAEVTSAWAGRSSLLSAATAREMLTAQKTGFGLGFAVEGEGDALHAFHGGANVGFEAYFVVFPARGEGVVIMTNGSGGSKLAKEILRGVARDAGWPSYAPVERAVSPVDAAALRACAGAYEVTIDAKTKQRFEVVVDGAALVFRVPGDRPQRWLPMSEAAFFTEGSETTFEVVKAAGVVTELLIRQDNNMYHAVKTK